MAKIAFEEGYKKSTYFDFPKLTLESQEKARICVIDNPTVEYVHNLRRVITENGKPIWETKTFGRNNEKTKEEAKTDFVGKFICLGDSSENGPLDTNGSDPDNCPACKANKETPNAVEEAKRRFVVHVIKYSTAKNSFNLNKPFQVELLAWEFAEKKFSSLVDIASEHGALNKLDLNLGPCINKGYQLFDIGVGAKCEFRADQERLDLVTAIIKEQRAADLSPLLGRRIDAGEMRGQVQDIVLTYNRAMGTTSALPTEPDPTDTTDIGDLGLGDGDDIFGEDVTTEAAPETAPETASTAASEPDEAPTKPSAPDESADADIDELLNGI